MFDRRKSENRHFTEVRNLSPPRSSGIDLFSTKSKDSSPQHFKSKYKGTFCLDECSVFPMFTSSSQIKSLLKLHKLKQEDLERLQFQLGVGQSGKLPKLSTTNLPKISTIFYPLVTKHRQSKKPQSNTAQHIIRNLSHNIVECEYRSYLKEGNLLELEGMHLEYVRQPPSPPKKRQSSINDQKRKKLVMYEGVKQKRKQKRMALPLERRPTPRKNVFEFTLFTSCILSINHIKNVKHTQKRFKFFIGEGNNSYLVKSTIRKRFWWTVCTTKKQANLVWTQLKNKDFMEKLNCLNPGAQIDAEYEEPEVQYPDGCNEGENPEALEKEKEQESTELQLQPVKLTDRVRLFAGDIKDNSRRCLEKLINQKVNSEDIQTAVKSLKKEDHVQLDIAVGKIHNHVQCHWHLSNKKALFANLKRYYQSINQDPFQYIPKTYHIKLPGDDQSKEFSDYFKQTKSTWIIKPGENTNRGTGISVSQQWTEIENLISTGCVNNSTVIVQEYIMPWLYSGRKFDIRCYMLVTSLRGKIKAYWYEEGYIRTSSKEFNMHNLSNRMIHLTNDAVQKLSSDYGKYQSCNKLSFRQIQKHFRQHNKNFTVIKQQMKTLAADCLKATYKLLDPRKRQYSFQIFGLDFLIDQKSKVWLIEVNTNPCLQLSGSLLARVIPHMVQNSLRIALDPLFISPQPSTWSPSRRAEYSSRVFTSNRYELLFDQQCDSV